MRKWNKSLCTLALLGAAGLTLGTTSSRAETNYPTHPIRLFVGFSAGSITDNTARVLAEQLEPELKQPIIVENIPGAGATMAAARAAKANPDGYTLLLVAMGHAVAPALYKKLSYDTLNDFTGVATVADARVMLVATPKAPFSDAQEFVNYAKAHPGEVTFGSSGHGTFLHLLGESMAETTGTKLLHVPYRSGAEVVTSVIGGTVDLAFCTINTCGSHVKAGKVKPIGFVQKQRHPMALDVPTFIEQGINLDIGSYNYILAPAGTPKPILNKLHTAIDNVVRSNAFNEKLRGMGLDPMPSENPEAVSQLVISEVDRWGKVVNKIGLKVE